MITNIKNQIRLKFLTSLFISYVGRSPLPDEIGSIFSISDLSKQIKEIQKYRFQKKSLLPTSNYTNLLFIGSLLEFTRYNLIKASEFNNPLTQLSFKGTAAFSEILKGKDIKKIDLVSLESTEIIYLIYHRHLRRIADAGAVKRWLQEKSKTELIEKLSSALLSSKEFQLHGRIGEFGNKIKEKSKSPVVYVDVTNTVNTGARTGIQRVVRRISNELNSDKFFFIFFNGKNFLQANLKSGEFSINEDSAIVTFCSGDIFLDIDASWGDRLDRNHLYQSLKKGGVRIVNLHYDAAPVLYPAYSHPTTVWRYLEHFCSMLVYSDHVICISHAVKTDLIKITQILKSRIPPMSVIDMGADIFAKEKASFNFLEDFIKNKFVLMVGTIEPRKNYQRALDNINFFKELGLSLVIVGKRGWESECFFKKLEEQEKLGNVIWLQNIDDEALTSLYSNCFLYLTTSHYEGYGLPVIEALQHGCCVISSNGGALPEAGKGASFVYESNKDLRAILSRFVVDEKFYRQAKSKASETEITSWKASASQLKKIVLGFFESLKLEPPGFNQLVAISTRPSSFKRLLSSFVSNYSLSSCVVLTKEECFSDFLMLKAEFPFPLIIFKDEDVLPKNMSNPEDHQERNFLLRKYLIQKPEVDEVFIMADDDYVVHQKPPEDYFLKNGKVEAGYCSQSLCKWLGSPFGITSFDRGRWNDAELLNVYGKSEFVFDAHRPQFIVKKDFNEIASEFEFIKGIGEWSVYFNIALDRYPDRYNAVKSTALHWPFSFSSWVPDFFVDDVFFENFYPDQENLTAPFKDRVSIFRSQYLLYRRQQERNFAIKADLYIDLDSKSLKGNRSPIGLSGIWSRVGCCGSNSVSLCYQIFDQREHLVVDGSRHHQYCNTRTGLMIKNPGGAGTYRVNVYDVTKHNSLGSFLFSIE